MFFFIDYDKKIIFGWSAKSGCSHIKMLFHFFTKHSEGELKPFFKDENLLHLNSYNSLPNDIKDFTIILFIRNPYERLVSGFLDKYRKYGQFNHLWNRSTPLTFRNFVNELVKGNSSMINRHHIGPQISERWEDRILFHSNLKVYDIRNIDYHFLENIFQKKIPAYILQFRGTHENRKSKMDYSYPVYDVSLYDYENDSTVPHYRNFFDDSIIHNVNCYFEKDLSLFSSFGFRFHSTF